LVVLSVGVVIAGLLASDSANQEDAVRHTVRNFYQSLWGKEDKDARAVCRLLTGAARANYGVTDRSCQANIGSQTASAAFDHIPLQITDVRVLDDHASARIVAGIGRTHPMHWRFVKLDGKWKISDLGTRQAK
jgi:hypothetical protein